jgi:hypothetical protein
MPEKQASIPSIESLEAYINRNLEALPFLERYKQEYFVEPIRRSPPDYNRSQPLSIPIDLKTSPQYLRAVILEYQRVFRITWNADQEEAIALNGGFSVGYRDPINSGGLKPLPLSKQKKLFACELNQSELIKLADDLNDNMHLNYAQKNKSGFNRSMELISPILPSEYNVYWFVSNIPNFIFLSSPVLSEIAVRFSLSASAKIAQGYLGAIEKTYGDNTIFKKSQEKLTEIGDNLTAKKLYFLSAPKNFSSFGISSLTSLISLPEIALRMTASSAVLAATLPILLTSKIAKIGEKKSSNPNARQNILEKSISHLAAYQQTLLAPRLNTPKYLRKAWTSPRDTGLATLYSLGYSTAGAVVISVATPFILTETCLRFGAFSTERILSGLIGIGDKLQTQFGREVVDFEKPKQILGQFKKEILASKSFIIGNSSKATFKSKNTPPPIQIKEPLISTKDEKTPLSEAARFAHELSKHRTVRIINIEELTNFDENLEDFIDEIKGDKLLGAFLDFEYPDPNNKDDKLLGAFLDPVEDKIFYAEEVKGLISNNLQIDTFKAQFKAFKKEKIESKFKETRKSAQEQIQILEFLLENPSLWDINKILSFMEKEKRTDSLQEDQKNFKNTDGTIKDEAVINFLERRLSSTSRLIQEYEKEPDFERKEQILKTINGSILLDKESFVGFVDEGKITTPFNNFDEEIKKGYDLERFKQEKKTFEIKEKETNDKNKKITELNNRLSQTNSDYSRSNLESTLKPLKENVKSNQEELKSLKPSKDFYDAYEKFETNLVALKEINKSKNPTEFIEACKTMEESKKNLDTLVREKSLKSIGENIKFLKQNPDLVSEVLKQEILTFRAKLPKEKKGVKDILSIREKIIKKEIPQEEFLEGLGAIDKYTKSQSSKGDERISTKDILQFKANLDKKIDTKFTENLESYIKLLESEDVAKFKIEDLKKFNKQFKALKISFTSPIDGQNNPTPPDAKLYREERLKALNALKSLVISYQSTEDKKKTLKDSIPIFKTLEKIKSSHKVENPPPPAPTPPPAPPVETPPPQAQIEAQSLTPQNAEDILGKIDQVATLPKPEAQIPVEATPTPAQREFKVSPTIPLLPGDAFAKMAKKFTTKNDNRSPSPSPSEELEAKRLSPKSEIGPNP